MMRSAGALLISLLIFGCDPATPPPPALTLATTTSTRDSGLLDVLLPDFETRTGIFVDVIAVGTGQALRLGRWGDADVLLTHAPDAEAEFMAEGGGELRRPVMFNDFVLVGPQHDPADVNGEPSILAALQRIATAEAAFVSRGDDSGTHMKERALWESAAVSPAAPWYLEAGGGMADILRVASEKRGYTLSDRATFLAQRGRLELVVLSEGDPLLHNVYSVIVVNSRRHPQVRQATARRFADYLTSPAAREIIGEFGIRPFGQPLFFLLPPNPPR